MARKALSGGDILCNTLLRLGVTSVFGLPGTQNVHLFEALRNSLLQTIVPTTELAAGFMAIGHFRATGKVAALVTIPGPGFTYALTPLAEARHDSAALIHLVVRSGNLPGSSFKLQALDQAEIARSFIKAYFQIETVNAIETALADAYRTAVSDEPGPVIVEIDSAVLSKESTMSEESLNSSESLASDVSNEDIEQVVDLLAKSSRPVLFLGQGAAGAADEVRQLIDMIGSAVIATNSGRGIVPENHPLFICGDSAHRTVDIANALIADSDLIIALGCKLTHNGSAGFQLKLPREKFVHVDTSREVLGANYPAGLLIHADAAKFLESLLQHSERFAIRPGQWEPGDLANRKAQLKAIIDESIKTMPRPVGTGDTDLRSFFNLLRETLPDDACVVTDSGLHQIMIRRLFEIRSPRGLILPSDFQSMGFGLPAAIGAKVADPDRTVVLVIGDGGMGMSAMELLTAARERINLPVMVINDGYLGQIRMQQLSNYGYDYAVKLRNPDFEALAHAFGINYFRPGENPRDTFRQWLSAPGVSLLDVPVEDSPQMRVERAKSVLKQAARDHLHSAILDWIKRMIGRGR